MISTALLNTIYITKTPVLHRKAIQVYSFTIASISDEFTLAQVFRFLKAVLLWEEKKFGMQTMQYTQT